MSCRALLLFFVLLLVTRAGHTADPDVRRLGSPGEPAGAFCERCVDGDFLVDNGRLEVVIGASRRRDESFYKFPTADALGSIVFARARGSDARGDIMLGTPYVRVGNTTRHATYDEVDVRQDDGRVEVSARGAWQGANGMRVHFEGRYAIGAGSDQIDVTLTATNAGEAAIDDLTWSVFFDPHQMYDFSPADHAAHSSFTFRGYPRARHLAAWIDPTRRVPTESDYEWNWDGGMILPDPVAVSLAPGAAETRRYTLVIAGEPITGLAETWRRLDLASVPVAFEIDSGSAEHFELVVRDAATSAIFYRSFFDRPAPVTIALPRGSYVATARFSPGMAQCTFVAQERGGGCRLGEPPGGQVAVRIVDSAGRAMPGKVTFRGMDGTPSPYFRPQNPAHDDGYWESAKNSVFPLKSTLGVAVPAGSYRVSASRGPLYSVDERVVTVVEGGEQPIAFTIDPVIDRPDLVSLDSHLHTLESDGAVTVAEKVRAIVAEGLDVAVATDHNYPVDYTPELERLGLGDFLLVAAGAEVTVPERLDYNTYPMAVRRGEHNHGAIDSLSTDLSALFAASRARDGKVILQINHPRYWQFDYFNWHGLDPASAAYAYAGFDLSFDVLEVVNGAVYETDGNRAARGDWFNLLRRGYFFPLVGTSDSHEIDQDEPGYSRTWVYHGEKRRADVTIDRLMERVRAGRSFASNGPLLDLVVGGRHGPGETFTPARGRVPVVLEVSTAPWMEADRARLFVNGVPQAIPLHRVAHASARRHRGEIELVLEADAFLVAEVTGTKALAPVVQTRIDASGNETVVTPYALTNPVFVDVDRNGRFDPPLPGEIEIRDPPAGNEPRSAPPGAGSAR